MKQKGFTLIELIIVIVILGILAVVAAPRFIDVQSDARRAVLEGIKGSLKGAASLVHSKAIIAGKQRDPNATTVNIASTPAVNVPIIHGYPNARVFSVAEVNKIMDIDLGLAADQSTPTEFVYVQGAGGSNSFLIAYTGAVAANGDILCYVIYEGADAAGALPKINVVGNAC